MMEDRLQTREAMLRDLMAQRDADMTAGQCLKEAEVYEAWLKTESDPSLMERYEWKARHYRRLAEMKAEG